MSAGKTLYILRHAKAETGGPNQEDADRALAPRGLGAATLMGKHMRASSLRPQLVLCSSAVRTRQTLAQIQECFSPPLKVEILDRMYNASASEILALLAVVPEEIKTVMVVAHNPGLHQLCLKLARAGDEEKLDLLAIKFPTTSFATINFEPMAWGALAQRGGTLVDFVTPLLLGGVDD